MSDPAERYYSPPPPSGLRERVLLRKRSLMAAGAIALAVVAVFAIALLASGDGKGSGHPERAFGGYISPADQEVLGRISVARNQANSAYLKVAAAARRGRPRAMTLAAWGGRAATSSGLEE